jgi:hypothetical protein
VPSCSRAGQVIQLAGVCTSPLGPVTYYLDTGSSGAPPVTNVTCPSYSGAPVIVEPRVVTKNGDVVCSVKGKRFSFVGESRAGGLV